MSCEELEIVWNNIKAEARTLADCEPMLASFYHATLLKHENLGSALSNHLGTDALFTDDKKAFGDIFTFDFKRDGITRPLVARQVMNILFMQGKTPRQCSDFTLSNMARHTS